MNLFKNNPGNKKTMADQAAMAEMALKSIHDGVIITDKNGVIRFINPAAATMTGYSSPDQAVGLDYGLVIKLQSNEGRDLSDAENPLAQAVQSGQALESFHGSIVAGQSGKIIPVSISVLSSDGLGQNRIITFRDITKELEEESEQAEFISTASHEMRTPVATIDGYISLALNPQTATIDERARNYLDSAQKASKHLGKLFHDLLDVTKLDDGHIRPHFEPVEMVSLIEEITNESMHRAEEGKVDLKFGASKSRGIGFGESRRLGQVVYGYVDPDFMHEIMDNLIENAIKYTPNGGSIYVNVRGDGDRVLINVTDSGIGISADDLAHIFQKFYRADNSDTRTIGGTGLGLYLVKQRVEAMSGRIWAESAFGEGSTFYVSLPRLTHDEYEKRMIAVRNQRAQEQAQQHQAAVNSLANLSVDIPGIAPVTPVAGATSADANNGQGPFAPAPGNPFTSSTPPSENPFASPTTSTSSENPFIPANTSQATPPEGSSAAVNTPPAMSPNNPFISPDTTPAPSPNNPFVGADSSQSSGNPFISAEAPSGTAIVADSPSGGGSEQTSDTPLIKPSGGILSQPPESSSPQSSSGLLEQPADSSADSSPGSASSLGAAAGLFASSSTSSNSISVTGDGAAPGALPSTEPVSVPSSDVAPTSAISPGAAPDSASPSIPDSSSPSAPNTTPAPQSNASASPAVPYSTTPVTTPTLPSSAPAPADLMASLGAAMPQPAQPSTPHPTQFPSAQPAQPPAVMSPASQPTESPPISPPPIPSANEPPDNTVPKQIDINLNGESK